MSQDELAPDPVPPAAASAASQGPDEDRALKLAQLGDRDAFAVLFGRFAPDVDRLCRRMIGAQEAEDARNEVFLRAQRALPGYDPGRPLRTWLLSIAAHHCIDRLRRKSVEGRLFEAAELDETDLPAQGPTPLRAALDAEERARLAAAIDSLPERYRAPLVMRYFADLSYDEIAESLDVTRGQVGTLLFRAKARLRTSLSGETR